MSLNQLMLYLIDQIMIYIYIYTQKMCSLLKSQSLWRIVTSEILKPTQKKDEHEEKFTERLEKWDDKNHQILT